MQLSIRISLLCVLVLGLTLLLSGGEPKQPLDLPAGVRAYDGQANEDQPETIIFYGQEYESDAFFWCLDRSCSMGWGSPTPLSILKQEVTQALQSLSASAQFGVVAFSDNHTAFSRMPSRASLSAKAAATAWIQAQTADGLTCLGAAGVATLAIANQCRLPSRSVILLSDGVPNCPNCEAANQAVTTANWRQIPIHTIFIGDNTDGSACLQSISQANGGSFTQVH